MKFTNLAMSLAIACCLTATTAFGEGGLRQPGTQTGYESYDAYYSAAQPQDPMKSPSDKAPAAPEAAAPAESGCGCNTCNSCNSCNCGCCDSCCCRSGCGCLSGCALDCPEACPEWKLFDDCCCLKSHNIAIYGWLEAGYTANSKAPVNRFNGPDLFNDRDELMGNQLYLITERTTDSSSCCWDVGGRVDLLYGTDARFIQSLGLELHQDGSNKWNGERFYQLAMPQVYAEFARNDWKIKVGKFNTPLEYEVIGATGNFFYSHTYGFAYAPPFTQTGIYATHDAGGQVSYGLGVTRGWDVWEDPNDKGNFTGHISAKDESGDNVLVFALTTGDEFAVTGEDTNRTAYTINWTHKVNDRTTWVLAHDLGVQADGDPQGGDATWYGIEYYWMYQLSCDWWFGARLEWFDDPEGTRVSQTTSGNSAAGPFRGSFYDVTVGLNYKPLCNPNLIVRPEVRYDWYSGKPSPNSPGAGDPYDDGNSDDQLLFAIDVIYKF